MCGLFFVFAEFGLEAGKQQWFYIFIVFTWILNGCSPMLMVDGGVWMRFYQCTINQNNYRCMVECCMLWFQWQLQWNPFEIISENLIEINYILFLTCNWILVSTSRSFFSSFDMRIHLFFDVRSLQLFFSIKISTFRLNALKSNFHSIFVYGQMISISMMHFQPPSWVSTFFSPKETKNELIFIMKWIFFEFLLLHYVNTGVFAVYVRHFFACVDSIWLCCFWKSRIMSLYLFNIRIWWWMNCAA